ncbi:MAG: primosomal protein N' [Candidatus Magnetominusculus sp. LBB02]|nr:primosomal protein N' [Candidatus Magnetominusculus sp. LBB02]
MLIIDILFPYNLRPLTYLCPVGLEDKAAAGTLVYAPLKGKTRMGIIYGIDSNFKGKPKTLKEISGLCGHRPALPKEMMSLIEWISGHYLSEPGLALSFVLPSVFFTDKTFRQRKRAAAMPKTPFKPLKITKEDLNATDANKPVLFQSPSYDYQMSYICKAAKAAKKALVLCPTVEEAANLGAVFFGITGIRPIIIHGGLTASQRLCAIEEASGGGKYSIVIGTMSAALFPFIKPSLIIVSDEHSPYYKHERTPRYNARDVAVMRASLENIPVVLMSACPSSDSYFKAATSGRYTYYKPAAGPKRPQVSVVASRSFKKLIPDRVTAGIAAAAEKGGKSFVYINKKGYAAIICKDCGHVEKCPVCKTMLTFYDDMTMRCRRCGYSAKPHDFCPVCSGLDMRKVSPGAQQMEEFIREKTGRQPVRIDSDTAKTPAMFKRAASNALKGDVLVGTKLALNKILFSKRFKLLAAVNPDVYFSFPDYLSAERLYQDVLTIAEMAEKDGRLYLLTALKDEPTYKFLEHYDYEGFMANELNKRSELNYPPFWKMAVITLHYNGDRPLDIKLQLKTDTDVQLLGPAASEDTLKGFNQSSHLIIKAKDSALLIAAARQAADELRKLCTKNKIRLIIDIDPV